MGHELTATDRMWSGHAITPWHTLGDVEEGTISVSDARAKVAPWEPEFIEVYVNAGSKTRPKMVPIPGFMATRRPDTKEVLGVMSDEYGLFRNASGFELAEKILDEGDGQIEVETAGTLKGGRYVWVLCWMNREVDINGDRFEPYLLVTWGHDGKTALTVANVWVRVVCANTRTAALDSAKRVWRAAHFGTIEQRAKEARHVLKIADEYESEFAADVERFLKKRVSDKRFKDVIVPGVFKTTPEMSDRKVATRERKQEAVVDLWLTADSVQPWKGTGWGALQAFSVWEEHERRVQGSRDERRALRVIGQSSGRSVVDTARELILA